MRNLIFLLIISSSSVFGQQMQLRTIATGIDASFRGLSVVDDSVTWVSGSNGRIGRSMNGGNNWTFTQVKGFEKSDFRSLYAFNEQKAIIANAGSPAYILLTNDGGMNWEVVYKNEDTAAFFDGIDFWNDKEGVIYGDPINAKMLLFRTINGGKTWKMLPEESRPILESGEASFAASGTNVKCWDKNNLVIATGGTVSRLWISENKGLRWQFMKTPIMQGQSSTGIFSFAYKRAKSAVIIGGDYKNDTISKGNAFYTNDNGKTWSAPVTSPRGYKECVTQIDKNRLVATGPRGTDISNDGGINWIPFSDEKLFHVIKKSRKGNCIIIAGGKGKIGVLQRKD